MKVHLFEAVTAGVEAGNWGKFAVAVPDDEWRWQSSVDDAHDRARSLLRQLGWGPRHVWVWDLQTGEGAMFFHGGHASADLNKRRIWVCVLFEPFLRWLYQQDLKTLADLPKVVELEAPVEFYGFRRDGMWFDRGDGSLRVLPGPGVCVMACLRRNILRG